MKHNAHTNLHIRFKGGRFDAGIMPTSVLASLDQLAKLIGDVAWREYSQETGATRRTKAFNQAMELGIADIKPGSSIATFTPTTSPSQSDGNDDFDQARQKAIKRIHQTVEDANSEKGVAESLEPDLLARFNSMIPDLRDDEHLGFPDATGTNPTYAELTHSARANILTAAKTAPETRRETLYAFVPQINKRTRKFELQAADGSLRQNVDYSDEDFETLRTAWESYQRIPGDGKPVRIVGQVEVTPQGKIKKIISVEKIEQIDPLHVTARLHDLSTLRDGWYNGKGTRYSRAYLDELAERFDNWYPADLPKPAIFPIAYGALICEWSLSSGECNLEINPDSDAGDWIDFVLDDDDDCVERSLDLSRQADWEWMTRRVEARSADSQP